jgi:hypothetical protein
MPFYTVIFGRANVYTRGLDGYATLIFGVVH